MGANGIYLPRPSVWGAESSAPKRSRFGGVVLGAGGFRYLRLVDFSMVNVGKYTIHGCYGIRSFSPFSKA